jgi:hypothetical protein
LSNVTTVKATLGGVPLALLALAGALIWLLVARSDCLPWLN